MDPISVETLKTIPGQAIAIGLAAQVIKLVIPWLRQSGQTQDNIIQAGVVVLGVGLSVYYTAPTGGAIPAAFNGLVAALAAMKGFDFVSTGLSAAKKSFMAVKKSIMG